MLERPAAELADVGAEWIAGDRALTVAVEDALAAELGLRPGELLLDYPAKTQMLELDLPVQLRDGRVRRLTSAGWPAAMNLPRLSEELYRSARWLRVFTAHRLAVPERQLLDVLARPADAVRAALAAGEPLLR